MTKQRAARPLVAAVAALLLGCGAGDRARNRPNIVLVVLCSFRLDHAGFAGYGRATTPFLDRLAAEGEVFDNAFSASSWTKPATTSLLTGLTPNAHQLVDGYRTERILGGGVLPHRVLPDRVLTLAESLRDAGYATACRVNNVHAGAFFNLTQGCEDAVTRYHMRTARMIDDLAAWLRHLDGERPFFFLIFTLDAHIPYSPEYRDYRRFYRGSSAVPETELEQLVERTHREVWSLLQEGEIPDELRRLWIDLYDAALAGLDRRLSRLPEVLATAGVESETVIVVTADHGESFFEPGRGGFRRATHGFDLGDALIRIPLLFRGPSITPGRRVERVVRSIDLFPTLAELAVSERPAHLQGRSLVPLLHGREDRFPRLTAFASRAAGAHQAVHDGRFKLHYRHPDRRQLYDTAVDPWELRNILAERPAVARSLEQELAAWQAQEESLREVVGEVWSREPTPEVVEELRSLGYL
jgi:arylsulfatase A-like enzyme